MPYPQNIQASDGRVRDAYGVAPGADARDRLVNAIFARTAGGSPQTQDTRNYLSGLTMNVEGLLDAYTQKFGPQAAQIMLKQLPNMDLNQLRALEQAVSGAAREADAQVTRETRGVGTASYPR